MAMPCMFSDRTPAPVHTRRRAVVAADRIRDDVRVSSLGPVSLEEGERLTPAGVSVPSQGSRLNPRAGARQDGGVEV